LSARSIATAVLLAFALSSLASCAGTTTAVGVTTVQDADKAGKHP
jgi:hypothetical protein